MLPSAAVPSRRLSQTLISPPRAGDIARGCVSEPNLCTRSVKPGLSEVSQTLPRSRPAAILTY